MKDLFKNKNILVIIFELIIIALGIIGITFATSKLLNDRTGISVTTGEYGVDFKGNTEVNANNLSPVSDSLININSKDNVIRLEFSLKGLKKDNDTDLIYDVMLKDINIDCGLLNKYTKWNLYKNGSLLSSGSFDPLFDGNILNDYYRLTNIQEDLKKSNDNYDDYVLLLWISESCNDIGNCEIVDQSGIINSKVGMKLFIALFNGNKKQYERVPNYDTSCASRPVLTKNMIPVSYNNGTWIVSDTTNSNKDNLWYDYNDSKWANSVIVTDSNKYKEIGTVIENNDILGYFVWIPRYRYKLWNVEDTINDSYNAYEKGIDIKFESSLNNVSANSNNEYLTHPAFDNNLKGFWISKYEISKDNNIYKFIPNVESYRNDTLDNYKTLVTNISNDYKLDNGDINIVNNYEWGATLYLSHSLYGVCKNNSCSNIDKNTTYISGSNKQDTTTRNVFGVYDMAGASGEYVIGNSNNIGSATKEIIIDNGNFWGGAISTLSDRDYIIRGGIDKGLFYFGDYTMDYVENSTRVVITNK